MSTNVSRYSKEQLVSAFEQALKNAKANPDAHMQPVNDLQKHSSVIGDVKVTMLAAVMMDPDIALKGTMLAYFALGMETQRILQNQCQGQTEPEPSKVTVN